MRILYKIDKKCHKLRLSLINIITKKKVFHHTKRIGKNLNQFANQLLLMCCMYHTIGKKYQAILLVTTDGEKLHYLAVKSLSAFFRGITSNDEGDFYCFFIHLEQKVYLKSVEMYAKTMNIAG